LKIIIELPTWLGDAVMTSPAIKNIISKYPKCEITLIGSFVSVNALKKIPGVSATTIIDKSFHSLKKIYNLDNRFDLLFCFRSSLRSKAYSLLINAKKKFFFNKKKYSGHQVERYNSFVCSALNFYIKPGSLDINYQKKTGAKKRMTLGLNPGATYGNAKRWSSSEFAKVARKMSDKYDIIIFGGPNEISIAQDIESKLSNYGVKNFKNLAGKTSVESLIKSISELDLFITNDSGPMHIAAALEVKTLAIFGPTDFRVTSPWRNKFATIVHKNLPCQPCMKRVCPLVHNNCMTTIQAKEVLDKLSLAINNKTKV